MGVHIIYWTIGVRVCNLTEPLKQTKRCMMPTDLKIPSDYCIHREELSYPLQKNRRIFSATLFFSVSLAPTIILVSFSTRLPIHFHKTIKTIYIYIYTQSAKLNINNLENKSKAPKQYYAFGDLDFQPCR